MTEHRIEWTPDATLDTSATTVITQAEALEQRLRKPTHFVPLEERLDEVMRNRLRDLYHADA